MSTQSIGFKDLNLENISINNEEIPIQNIIRDFNFYTKGSIKLSPEHLTFNDPTAYTKELNNYFFFYISNILFLS